MFDYGIVIQARASSTRLPNKVLMDIEGLPMLFRQVDRIKHFIPSVPVIVATSNELSDDPIQELCEKKGIDFYRGSLKNVVLRFIECADNFNLENIIRVGGDDPLIDSECCKALINSHKKEKKDFIYASSKEGWPYGTAAELISKKSLEKINFSTTNPLYREHTIPYFFDNADEFSIKKIKSPKSISRPDYYFTVDFPEDLKLIRNIFAALKKEGDYFPFTKVIELIDDNKDILNINKHLHDGFSR
jgi:spore coat polysaccharide biosynthesis protein SpsF